jgi:hypothetical protein
MEQSIGVVTGVGNGCILVSVPLGSPSLSEDVVQHLEYTDNLVLHARREMAKPNEGWSFGNQWLDIGTGGATRTKP